MESSDSLAYDSHQLLTLLMTPLFHFHSVVSALMTATPTLIPLLLKISPKGCVVVLQGVYNYWELL